jgi:hypothetical protein
MDVQQTYTLAVNSVCDKTIGTIFLLGNLTMKPKLTRQQWDELYEQFSRTPNVGEPSTDTGEHWQLIALLNQLGYFPNSRDEAIRIAQELLDNGYD